MNNSERFRRATATGLAPLLTAILVKLAYGKGWVDGLGPHRVERLSQHWGACARRLSENSVLSGVRP